MQECAGIFVGSGNGWPEDGLERPDVAPPRLGDELLLRTDLHNLTLNTDELGGSVSALSRRRTYTGKASCVPKEVDLIRKLSNKLSNAANVTRRGKLAATCRQ